MFSLSDRMCSFSCASLVVGIECVLSNVPLLTLALLPSPTQANLKKSHSGRRSSCTSPPQSFFGSKRPINDPADARAQYGSIDQHWEASRLGKSERQGAHAATANLKQTRCAWANEGNQPMQLQAGREHTGRDRSDLAGGRQRVAINNESSGHTESFSDESYSDKFGSYSESSESEIEAAAGERKQSASDDALVQQQQQAQILKIPLKSVFI